MKCEMCGTGIGEETVFCPKCGTKVLRQEGADPVQSSVEGQYQAAPEQGPQGQGQPQGQYQQGQYQAPQPVQYQWQYQAQPGQYPPGQYPPQYYPYADRGKSAKVVGILALIFGCLGGLIGIILVCCVI